MERLAEQNSTADANSTQSGTAQSGTAQSGTAQTGTAQSETMNPQLGFDSATNSTNATSTANPASGTKRMLYRHPQDRLVGGVCGGISELIGMDANLVRILWVIATLLTGGGGILAYIALWMLLPVGTAAEGQVRPATLAINGLNMGRTATFLIALGGLWFLANIGVLPWLWGSFWQFMRIVFWPAVLIGIGYLLLNHTGRVHFNWNWAGTKEQLQNGMADRMPTKQSMKESFNTFRQRFPLKRSRTDRIFMGVCGGIGQRIGIDANLVRLVWAAFSVGSIGMGVLVYVLLGLFLTDEAVTTLQPYNDEMQDVQVIDARSTKL